MPEGYKRKLIEVALPLEAINREAVREKSIRHGHPSTLHLWWARRPLAVCRAVLFASLVDDPSSRPEEFPTEEAQERERQRLFKLIEELVKWENSNNEEILAQARAEILKCTGGNPPPVLDPFAGGGSIPLEAQRLGLEAHASDLNPVAVLINKALIEIPPKFAGRPPVNPDARRQLLGHQEWKGAAGLAEDIRYYGKWMRDEAERRIGHLYPKAKLPKEYGGGEATVIAWIWARTVKCPNPACGATMPLIRSFALSTKKGKEAWVEPTVDETWRTVRYDIRTGTYPESAANGTCATSLSGKKLKATFVCPVCRSGLAKGEYIDFEAQQGRLGVTPIAKVVEASSGKLYLEFEPEEAESMMPAVKDLVDKIADIPSQPCRGTFASNAQGRRYGFQTFGDYFTLRQIVALTTFSDLVAETRERVLADGRAAGWLSDSRRLCDGGREAEAYADAVAMYLAMAVDRLVDYCSSLCSWHSSGEKMRNTFARQAIPMVWDFAEVNPFSDASGNFMGAVMWITEVVQQVPAQLVARVTQADAANLRTARQETLVSTDPPYYDNVGYADLSDFFYVWLRRPLQPIFPELFATVLTPKAEELVATPYRFGRDRAKAKEFFETGLGKAFSAFRQAQHPAYPFTVYYAFKQNETDEGSIDEHAGEQEQVYAVSTGWETMLEGLLRAGFSVTGTWPMRSELSNRPVATGTNALASSIVLVCRPRPVEAPVARRKDFLNALSRELPEAVRNLQRGSIAPTDLAQALIGPGMAMFSRYSKVVSPDGTPMTVREALQAINQAIDEYFATQEGVLDPDTRFCLALYEEAGLKEIEFGKAEVLSKAKNTAIDGMSRDGILEARRGKVRLKSRDELPADWNPRTDLRPTLWECTQHLVRALEQGGIERAAELVAAMTGDRAEGAKSLAYRLYAIAERKGWTDEAFAYNSLVTSWPDIQKRAEEIRERFGEQLTLVK